MSNETYDWDAQLLGVDWTTVDWRTEIHNFQRVPWPQVQTATLRRLVAMHTTYDQNHPASSSWPISTPAADELSRRQALEGRNLGTENQSVHNWFSGGGSPEPVMDHPVLPPPTNIHQYGGTFLVPPNSPPDEGRGALERLKTPINRVDQQGERKHPGLVYKDDPDGFWTVGFELELPIAVYRRGGLLAERPHPGDARWEAEQIVSDDVPAERIRQIVVDRVIEVFSAQTDMVFVARDADEGDTLHDLRMENLHRLEFGMPSLEDDDEMTGSPLGADEARPVDPLADRAAREALDFLILGYFNDAEPARNFLLASRQDFQDAAGRAPIPGLPSMPLRREAEKRLEDLLNLEAYRRRRDKRHVPLAGMKPRYRAFSVYTTEDVNMDLVDGTHYREVPAGIENPSKLYGWQTVKIVSPVMRLSWPPTELSDVVTEVCRVVRDNFRVHLETPPIEATTQVSISHTSGLNIIDLKKLASFLGTEAVHRDLRQYNRWYRHHASYAHVCGPLRMVSRLGKLTQTNYDADGFDNNDVVPRHGPLRTDQLNRVAESYLPVDLMLQHENLAGRVFHQVIWQYTSVDTIANALATGNPPQKGEVVVKCRGSGDVVSRPAADDPEEELRRSEQEASGEFREVDKDRGVVEFRQMGLSLDPRHIAAWILVCWRIMEFVRASQPPQYRLALEQVMRGGVSVLDAIGLDPEVRQYMNELISQPGQGLHSDNRITDWRDPFYPRHPQ
ncbi:hypothetical protein F4811DRAFT_573830 [Daldinia bambusicola]|nr:hypothetical protein F4811DRAFT_573830 [Daldinia bambusicola]